MTPAPAADVVATAFGEAGSGGGGAASAAAAEPVGTESETVTAVER